MVDGETAAVLVLNGYFKPSDNQPVFTNSAALPPTLALISLVFLRSVLLLGIYVGISAPSIFSILLTELLECR
jgi:hypothetical protein